VQHAVHHIEVAAPVPVHVSVAPVIDYAQFDLDYDIPMPQDQEQAELLVRRFRKEILRDWVNDLLAEGGLGQFRINKGYFDFHEIDEIIHT
jgi:hypothetical protein